MTTGIGYRSGPKLLVSSGLSSYDIDYIHTQVTYVWRYGRGKSSPDPGARCVTTEHDPFKLCEWSSEIPIPDLKVYRTSRSAVSSSHIPYLARYHAVVHLWFSRY